MIFKTIMDKSGWEVTELVPVFRDTVLMIYQKGKIIFRKLQERGPKRDLQRDFDKGKEW